MINLNDIWERADELRENYYGQKTMIENDGDLNDAARKRKLEEFSDQANGEMDDLRKQWYDSKIKRKEEIIKSAFGIGHTMNATEADKNAKQLNYRNALDIASRADSEDDLARLLEDAEFTGDDLLKKAVGTQARKHRQNRILQRVMNDSDDFKELMRLDLNEYDIEENFHFTKLK